MSDASLAAQLLRRGAGQKRDPRQSLSLTRWTDRADSSRAAHQVTFSVAGSYVRPIPRCELSDLIVVVYSLLSRQVRLTYLQAKSERKRSSGICGHHFAANLEQWNLLATRPRISGVAGFNPSADLLSSAVLSSVGAFVFFYKTSAGDFQIYYASANYLIPACHYSQRYGKVRAQGPCMVLPTLGHLECKAACRNASFAESLYRLEIGTPIDISVSQAAPTRHWLAAQLRSSASQIATRTSIVDGLLDVLGSRNDARLTAGSFGAKSLIIIRAAD